MKMINNNGPRTDLCGIPEIISHQSLKLKPIFLFYDSNYRGNLLRNTN